MQTLLKLETIIVPVERIRLLNLAAQIKTENGSETGIELGVYGLNDTFQFTGQAAKRVFDVVKDIKPATAPPTPQCVTVTINGVETAVESLTTIDGTEIPVSVVIGNEVFHIADIEWIDLATNFGDEGLGIEMRLASDPEGQTRQYVNDLAKSTYSILVGLVSNSDVESLAA